MLLQIILTFMEHDVDVILNSAIKYLIILLNTLEHENKENSVQYLKKIKICRQLQ